MWCTETETSCCELSSHLPGSPSLPTWKEEPGAMGREMWRKWLPFSRAGKLHFSKHGSCTMLDGANVQEATQSSLSLHDMEQVTMGEW